MEYKCICKYRSYKSCFSISF